MAAAAELMFENGVAETTLEDIRAAAGVSGSQVYHYFEDKQALVRAVIDYQADVVLDAQGDHLDHLDTVPGLRAWRDFIVEHQRRLGCRGGCPIGALGAEVAETDAAARVAAARALRRWEGRIRDGLQVMHARGDLPAGTDPEQLALATLAALQGGLLDGPAGTRHQATGGRPRRHARPHPVAGRDRPHGRHSPGQRSPSAVTGSSM